IGSKYQGGIVFQWNDSTGKTGVVALEKDLPDLHAWDNADSTCNALMMNGYSDWRLPTREEIAVLYANRVLVGGFESGYYWSRSSYVGQDDRAFFQSFVHGDRLTQSKSKKYRVRPVRFFRKK
ncbi:MAG TPA: DUF1566 domain-containing protein, partial [Flavobacteriales bacterium]|nr:DUF1566 domain-containing protein [Flavobacteriales bacterium]